MQEQPLVVDRDIAGQMVEPRALDQTRAAHDAMHLIPLLQ